MMMHLVCEADYNLQSNGLRILKQEQDMVRSVLLKGHLGIRVEYIVKKDRVKEEKPVRHLL